MTILHAYSPETVATVLISKRGKEGKQVKVSMLYSDSIKFVGMVVTPSALLFL